eukprot:6209468-Pleurochrysis_carterae.AAC.2
MAAPRSKGNSKQLSTNHGLSIDEEGKREALWDKTLGQGQIDTENTHTSQELLADGHWMIMMINPPQKWVP